MNRELAKITNATLLIREEKILNLRIDVDYETGSGATIQGIILDNWNNDLKNRVGTAYGCEVIRRLLMAFDVDDLSQLKGKVTWVLGTGKDMSFIAKGLQPLYVNSHGIATIVFHEIYEYMAKYDVEIPKNN